MSFLLFISSGLFLGWSLGANDAANVFGTAVGTRMIRFRLAAIVCSLCVIAGAVLQGGGAAKTLDALGSINALPGAFAVALAAAVTVAAMTRSRLPVSTSQAIVGGIIGWNLFSGLPTDPRAMANILGSWAASPVLGGLFAVGIFVIMKWFIYHSRIHLLHVDGLIRTALLLAGAFGSYSLGANNIANVMGVFVASTQLQDIDLSLFSLGNQQQLFLLGGLAIALGVFTYSRRIMETVGKGLYEMTSEAAIAIVLAHGIVLFLFSSAGLQQVMAAIGLPPLPLVPVSSSHTIIGAVLGIGLLYGGRNIRYRILWKIVAAWILTPLLTGILAWLLLAFLQNVFLLEVVAG